MKQYEIEFKYKLPEWGSITMDAMDLDEAEMLGLQYIKDTYENIEDVEIDTIKELKVLVVS